MQKQLRLKEQSAGVASHERSGSVKIKTCAPCLLFHHFTTCKCEWSVKHMHSGDIKSISGVKVITIRNKV